MGGNGSLASGIPKFYALVWNNNVIIFARYRDYIKNENSVIANDLITKIFAPMCLEGCDDEILNMIKESVSVNMVALSSINLPPSIPKYNLKFRHKPQYMLGGNDYKDKTALTLLLALTINDFKDSNKSTMSKIFGYLKKVLVGLFFLFSAIELFTDF